MTKKKYCVWLIFIFKRDLSLRRWNWQPFKPWLALITRGWLEGREREAEYASGLYRRGLILFHLYWAGNIWSEISCYRFSISSVSPLFSPRKGEKRVMVRDGQEKKESKNNLSWEIHPFPSAPEWAHEDTHAHTHRRIQHQLYWLSMGSHFQNWWVWTAGYLDCLWRLLELECIRRPEGLPGTLGAATRTGLMHMNHG